MTDWSKSLKDIVSLVADSKAILGIGAGGLTLFSVAGVIPRLGIVRALTLGWRGYFKPTYPLSVRKLEIQQLNDSIVWMERGSYITVIGGFSYPIVYVAVNFVVCRLNLVLIKTLSLTKRFVQ